MTSFDATLAPVRSSYGEGAVEVLGLPITLDGRTSTHPAGRRGTAFMNVALVERREAALLVDTGLTTQLRDVTAWLDDHLAPGTRLSIFPLRISEFDSVCNVVPLVERYDVDRVCSSQWQGFTWFDFRIDDFGRPWTGGARYEKVPRAGSLPLGAGPDLEIFQPDLMLVPTHWIFDPASGTLLTSDAFGHVTGCAVQFDSDVSEETERYAREHLVGNRYWWLPGARTGDIAGAVRRVFAEREVKRIVPAHGAVLEGAEVVERHVELLCGLLDELGTKRPTVPAIRGAVRSGAERPPIRTAAGAATGRLPRELRPGIAWLGECLEQRFQGNVYHSYNSIYVVSGTERSLIVEGGFPGDLAALDAQLDELLARGIPPVEYLFATHCETPHSSGFGRFLRRFPDSVAIGGVHDLHLVFPEFADRIHVPGPDGVDVDLGGRRFRTVPAVIRDLEVTYWGFDSGAGALFPGDGFAFSHYHADGHCGLVAEEAGSLDVPDMTALFAELALGWTRHTDLEPHIAALDELLDHLHVGLIGPTHGLPITDLDATVPEVIRGLRIGARF